MKDVKSILLMLLSFFLVSTWVYHLYDKNQYTNKRIEIPVRDSAAVADGVRDSLHRLYNSRIAVLDAQLDSVIDRSDSLNVRTGELSASLQSKLKEIKNLRREIRNAIGTDKNTSADLTTANKKVEQLEARLAELLTENVELTSKNENLAGIITGLNLELVQTRGQIKQLEAVNLSLTARAGEVGHFTASNLTFNGVDIRGSKQHVTSKASKVNILAGTFVLMNAEHDYPCTTIHLNIYQPDGTLLIPSDEIKSATFTKKIITDYQKAAEKAVSFAISTSTLSPGVYQLEVWHNGILAGKTALNLE